RNEQKRDLAIRQLGFQETDIVSMVGPITKAAWRIQEPEQIPARLMEAFTLAQTGRPGPVLLDIPMDVQREQIACVEPSPVSPKPVGSVDRETIEQLFEALAFSRRPLVLVGGGIRSSRAVKELRNWVELTRIPVVNSLMAVDVLPYAHPLRIGMIG